VSGSGQRDHALPAFVENRDGAGRLHDLLHAEAWQRAGQAAFAQAEILRAIGAVDDPVAHDLRGQVVGRRFMASRRDRARRDAKTGDVLRAFARVDRLHQREHELAHLTHPRLHGGGQWRDSAVGWIDDERGARADRARGIDGIRLERDVVCAGQILERAACRDAVAALWCAGGLLCPFRFTLTDFVGCQQRFGGIAGRALQRNLVLLRPDTLKVGVAPRGLRGCAASGDRMQRAGDDRRRDECTDPKQCNRPSVYHSSQEGPAVKVGPRFGVGPANRIETGTKLCATIANVNGFGATIRSLNTGRFTCVPGSGA
jgi:hypothetical protein